jgi:hypothetical protein
MPTPAAAALQMAIAFVLLKLPETLTVKIPYAPMNRHSAAGRRPYCSRQL